MCEIIVLNSVEWTASNINDKLLEHHCHCCWETVGCDLQHIQSLNVWHELSFRNHFYLMLVQKEAKPGLRSTKPAPLRNEKIWTSMNLYGVFWISACRADFHLLHPSKRDFFHSINTVSECDSIWRGHALLFQRKPWCCSLWGDIIWGFCHFVRTC